MRGPAGAMLLPPEVVLAYCEQERANAQRWEERAASTSRALDQERHRRETADERVEALEQELEGTRGESAQRVQQVETLQEALASLELEKSLVERRLARALDEIDRLRRETGGDDEAVRRRVLKNQALRARLGKTDMSPWSRMQTLQQADDAGIELSREQFEELMNLQLRYG